MSDAMPHSRGCSCDACIADRYRRGGLRMLIALAILTVVATLLAATIGSLTA